MESRFLTGVNEPAGMSPEVVAIRESTKVQARVEKNTGESAKRLAEIEQHLSAPGVTFVNGIFSN